MALTHKSKSQIKAAGITVIVLLTLIVVFQNTGAVDTKVLFGAFTLPLALLLGLTFGSGMMAGAAALHRWNQRRQQE